ncbi:MAG: PAS domain S-box protein [Puia sp.]|nr:PAS domain S-box protein [Puia sp.]
MQEIIGFFGKLFDSADWPPRWHCGKWTGLAGWLYIISDLLIWAAYFAIPLLLLRFIIQRLRQRRSAKLIFLFAAFILACGSTHFLDAMAFWIPMYRLSALLRAVTAVVSWLTVFSLIRVLPYASSLKDPRLLEAEIEMRKKAETELQQKNEQVEESRQTFKNAFEYSSIGIALVSPEGRWLDVNHAVCNMFGYTKEELSHLSFQDITHPDDLAMDLDQVARLLRGELETYRMEKRYYAKDGAIVWALLSVSLVWKDEKPSFFISQIVDITANRRLQEEVEKKNIELRQANEDLQIHIARISEFNRIVGHNLRGPASSLINLADYLDKSDNETDRNFLLSRVKGTAGMIIHTLNDLKEFLEIQLNQEQHFGPVGFKETLNNAMRMLDEQILEADPLINVSFDIGEVGMPRAYLESIFYNLLSNAIKYRDRARPLVIDIKSAWQAGSADEPAGYILLTIKDNGIGIDMNKFGKEVFKYKTMFHKGYESSGVGLFLTRTQIEACNGRIEMESEAGRGTTLRIFFKKDNTGTV